jgi:hypothetical protein
MPRFDLVRDGRITVGAVQRKPEGAEISDRGVGQGRVAGPLPPEGDQKK